MWCLVAQSCPTLGDPTDCSPPGSSVHGDSPGKNTGVDCYALLQGIIPTQDSSPGLLHCRQILYCLSHQGSLRNIQYSPKFLGVIHYNKPLLQCSIWTHLPALRKSFTIVLRLKVSELLTVCRIVCPFL